jgi:hypothetical protein
MAEVLLQLQAQVDTTEPLKPRRRRCLIEPAITVELSRPLTHQRCASRLSQISTEPGDSSCEEDSLESLLNGALYPPLRVRNTFLEVAEPKEHPAAPHSAPPELQTVPMAKVSWVVRNTFVELADDAPASILEGCRASPKPVSCPCSLLEDSSAETEPVTEPGSEQSPATVQKFMLVLDDMIASGVPHVLPSKGSADHALGQCTPCAFFHQSGGCSFDSRCDFCHLCDSEERRKRRKEKVARLRARRHSAFTTSS